ncbi:MAG: zinc-ribbon domain-containing protein [Lachnospiraceae bacterium]|jgi:hypothetical protein|nr:zinc-ribbon domain-containing protein [Lachnospiraceae bacterium]
MKKGEQLAMQCTKCGQNLPEGVTFCPYCGEKAAAKSQEADEPLFLTEVRGLLKAGRLAVYRDRVEFSTSSAQKTVFNYDSLVAVRKRVLPTPAVLFVTEDGRTESCAATSKNIHEVFLYIEQAVRPYIEARKERLLAQGIKYSLVSSMGITGGILNISDDKVEFHAKSGKKETLSFQDVKSVSLYAGSLEFSLFDGGTRTFALDKESRDDVLPFIKKALEPYLAKRKAELLAKGIYYSFLSNFNQESGTLNIYEDRVEFTAHSGRTVSTMFKDVRTAGLYSEMLELCLVDGSTKVFGIDTDEQNEILSFVKKAILPYVRKRTEGFTLAFGLAERIEINKERGVFHIIRQGGAVITQEYSLENIVKCQQDEPAGLNPMISGIRLGGKAIANKAAGRQGTADTEETIRSTDMLLTIRTGQGQQVETVRFGDFPLGMSRTSPKYAQYAAEAAGLMDYLAKNCPECERVIPAPPAPGISAKEIPANAPGDMDRQMPDSSDTALFAASAEDENVSDIYKYIRRTTGYIHACQTPWVIAFQGSSESGEGMQMLEKNLAAQYGSNLIRLHGRQLSRPDLGEKLPLFIGACLVSRLGGANDGRAAKFGKAFISLAVTLISQGNSDGQLLIDAFSKDNPADPLEDLLKTFSDLVKKKCGGEKNRVVVLLDGLDSLAPAKAVGILEALEYFLGCEKCVFVIAIDYASVIRGIKERYGQEENDGKTFFNKIFRISFRPPASDFQLENYVKNKLEHIEMAADDSETGLYCSLLACSIGSKPESIDHLFDSFQLLKTLADREIYEERHNRLILFGLLCMQMRFLKVYEQLVRIKASITPDMLSGLCLRESDIVARCDLGEEENDGFCEFARVFTDIINADHDGGISLSECGMFARVLEFSSITAR